MFVDLEFVETDVLLEELNARHEGCVVLLYRDLGQGKKKEFRVATSDPAQGLVMCSRGARELFMRVGTDGSPGYGGDN